MICSQCQTENPAAARFCQRCGQPLAPEGAAANHGGPTGSLPQSVTPVVPGMPPAGLPQPPRRQSRTRRALLAVTAGVLLLGAAGGGAYLYIQYQHNLHVGHWTAVTRSVPGQRAPTPAPGTFEFTTLGGYVDYAPPSVAPIAITWTSYHNSQDGYTVDTASNWQATNTPQQGHAEWLLCPPGTDLTAQEPGPPPCVSYGWVAQHQAPAASDPSIGMMTAITRGGVQGTLYTEAGMGASITAFFPHATGFVYLTADGDADAAMYAFQHMLASLTFQ